MFEIALSYILQNEDTDEWSNDEPYVIIFAADLANTDLIPIPGALSTSNGPYDIGGVIGFPVSRELCWGFDGQPRDIDDPNNPLILVALLESDHEDSPADFANSVRVGNHAMVMGALMGYIVDLNAGNTDIATLRDNVINDMRGAVDIFRQVDIENDERLGPVQLLQITAADLANAQSGIVEKKLSFVSGEEESNYELTFSIGTGVGSVSSGLSSSGPTDRYAAIWVKETGFAWVARHRMTSDEYQKQFDKFTGQGFRLIHINGYNYGGKVQFAAIWEKSAGPAWVARHNMTSGQYQAEFDKLTKDGYRLHQVSGYPGPGGDLYAAIWVKETGSAWVARHRMTAVQYQTEFNNLAQQGFRLNDISAYRVANDIRYAAIWKKANTNVPWVARHGMTSTRYQKEFNKLVNKGFRLVHVEGSSIHGKRYFSAIWEKSKGPAWMARHNMTSEQYQGEFEKLGTKGYRLVCVSGY